MNREHLKILTILCLLLMIGGCKMENKENINTDNKPHGESSIEKEIMKDNKVDEKLARKWGYVPIDEIDKMYDSSRNDEMKKRIEKDYSKIEEATKNYLKEKLGRDVEIGSMEAIYPYSAIIISYYTTERPTMITYINLNINDRHEYRSEDFYGFDELSIKSEVVKGIIRYSYEEEIKKMNDFIETNFPEFYINSKMKEAVKNKNYYPFVNISSATKNQTKTQEERATFVEEIYQLYIANPTMTVSEWRAILTEFDLNFNIDISVSLKNKQELPSDNRIKKLSSQFKMIPVLLLGKYSFFMKTSWVTIKHYHPLENIENNFKIEGDTKK